MSDLGFNINDKQLSDFSAENEIREKFRKEILEKIEAEESKLDDQDANGHIWWNKFREFIKEI